MVRRRRVPKVLFAIGAVLVVSAVVWRFVAVPLLVKYPTDMDATARYQGTLTAYVDPTTAAPLATPTQVPLTVERHIKAVGSESDSSKVVVDETIVERAAPLLDATQHNVYVMDRRTLLNVADNRAYAFEPSNVVDRSGSYRINLPFGTSESETYAVYKNETATTYTLRGDSARATGSESDLSVDNFVASASEVPLSPAYLAELNKSVPLPQSLTLDQLRPQLLAAGVDVDALLGALTPVISADDLAALTQLAGGTIPLHYVLSLEGRAAIEPTTGAQVHVTDTESIGAKPDLSIAPRLQEILGHYPDVPQAAAASDGLAKLAAAPATKLIELRYEQTPASVADVADQARSSRNRILLVSWYVPAALLLAGVVLMVVGGVLLWRRREDRQVIDLREPATTAAPVGANAPAEATPPVRPSTAEPVPGRRGPPAAPGGPA